MGRGSDELKVRLPQGGVLIARPLKELLSPMLSTPIALIGSLVRIRETKIGIRAAA